MMYYEIVKDACPKCGAAKVLVSEGEPVVRNVRAQTLTLPSDMELRHPVGSTGIDEEVESLLGDSNEGDDDGGLDMLTEEPEEDGGELQAALFSPKFSALM